MIFKRLKQSLQVWLACGFLTIGTQAQEATSNIQTIESQAAKGDAKAQYDLAQAYAQGKGVKRDYAKAVEYSRQSADQGYADAEELLGSFYGRGLGVGQDPAEAARWYRKAADQGSPMAEWAMGGFYAHGQGVTVDTDEAVKWWRRAADQNYAPAEDALGQFYFAQRDTNHAAHDDALKWLSKAAGHGYVDSMNNLGAIYDASGAWEEAAKWYRAAAEKGNVKAQGNLGALYLDGRGVTNDMLEAYVWLKLSADQGGATGRRYMTDFTAKPLLTQEQMAEGNRRVRELRRKIQGTNALLPHPLLNQNQKAAAPAMTNAVAGTSH